LDSKETWFLFLLLKKKEAFDLVGDIDLVFSVSFLDNFIFLTILLI
jgi:hypothetical protein